jgi:hypothetical protein
MLENITFLSMSPDEVLRSSSEERNKVGETPRCSSVWPAHYSEVLNISGVSSEVLKSMTTLILLPRRHFEISSGSKVGGTPRCSSVWLSAT